MDSTATRVGRLAIVIAGAVVAAIVGWILFVLGPEGNLATLLGIILAIIVALFGARFATNIAESVFAPYNVAEVSVEGPIQRQSGRRLPNRPMATPADAIVDQIEAATEDENAQGLIVHLNTPGGEVVPSDDIRKAVEEFDGPTVAYATDACASGGYWIASACDRIVAREGSIVGSIGVRGSRITAADLLEKVGLSYERLVAGEYKDAGVALREMDEADREYLQGIVDDYYDTFVERVTDGRDIDEATIRDTEARVFLGPEAAERGLVDEIGAEETVEEWLEGELAEPVQVREFEPPIGIATRFGMGASRIAFAFGAGLTAVFTEGEAEARIPEFRS